MAPRQADRPTHRGDRAVAGLPSDVATRRHVDVVGPNQAQAIDMARSGHSVVVVGRTNAGTAPYYQTLVAEAAADCVAGEMRPGTSLLVFPSKAWAHHQLRSMAAKQFPGVRPAAYDSEAGRAERARMRQKATVVFTNPEMLHSGLLPHHDRWAVFLSRLRFVAIDGLHLFGGLLGCHMAHVLRRLHRLAYHYGAEPTFVCCSAAIGWAARLAEVLCGVPFDEVSDQAVSGDIPHDSSDIDSRGDALVLGFLDLANPWVLDAQLRCAAHELPLTHSDARYWPGTLDDGVRRLALDDQVVIRRRRSLVRVEAVYSGGGWPSRDITTLR